jgi:TetR/AcrR family transcriptional repressor of nem operon
MIALEINGAKLDRSWRAVKASSYEGRTDMKITKEKAAENRQALIEAAGRLVRERGIDGVGVAEISEAAGLTHGALYAHFPSKEALAAEALTHGLQRGYKRMTQATDRGEPTLTDHLDFYLSKWHRDTLAGGCSMAASASEIARQDEAISARFSEGYLSLVGAVEMTLGDTGSKADAHQRALMLVAAMIGGVAVSRALAKSHPEAADEVLAAVRQVLGEVGGEAKKPRPRARKSR